MVNALQIDPRDNVAVVLEKIASGGTVSFRQGGKDVSLNALGDIIIYHKVAIEDIARGQSVFKYGERIGEAVVDIPRGSHVHTHNISNLAEDGSKLR